LKQFIFVFLGGGIGSGLRYLVGKYMPNSNAGFPWSTFSVNLIGCLIIGIVMGYFIRTSADLKSDLALFLTIGICGGFTTFSSFAYENISLIRSGDHLLSLSYIGLSLFLGVLMVLVGIKIEKFIF
jgi:CrcB protein